MILYQLLEKNFDYLKSVYMANYPDVSAIREARDLGELIIAIVYGLEINEETLKEELARLALSNFTPG